ncbi:MAG: polysaccharide biosynthesis/export family protein [Acidobacteriota bacterium]|nr:polysaccharide biosynthesis/export family protein [Acidobacteriota bacterium]
MRSVMRSLMQFRLRSRTQQLCWLVCVMLLLSLAAQAQFSGPAQGRDTPINTPVTLTTDPAILFPPAREIQIGVGDLLNVHLYPVTDYAPTARVALDGTVQLPLIGAIAVDGLSVHQVENLIAQKLTDAGMYRNPQVTVQVAESPNQVATLSGEVHAVVPVAGGKRLLDVLAAAGGLPPTASHVLTIERPGLATPIVVRIDTDPTRSSSYNIPIFAKDTIITSRVGVVYMLGAFKQQGAIPLQSNSPLTLMQVVSLAGGAGYEGQYNDMRLVRTIGTSRTVVKLNVQRVLNGKDPDPVLQADDIVFLPSNAMKAAIKVGGLSTVIAIASVLLYTFHP